MTLVRFFRADGTLDKEVEAEPGQRLLDVAWAAREPLEGACEGVMACSTCHVIVEARDFEKLPPATDEEEDLLDLAVAAGRTNGPQEFRLANSRRSRSPNPFGVRR